MRLCAAHALAVRIVLVTLVGLTYWRAAHAQPADEWILRGAAVYTLDERQPWASALVIRKGKIAYVGDDAGALALSTPHARVIALDGRMVLPGFHDAHMHPMSGGMRLLRCRLDDARTAQELYRAAGVCAQRKPRQDWLIGNGWASRNITNEQLQRDLLEAIAPDRAMYLANEDGFIAWVNAKALALAGIDPQGTQPEISGLHRDARTHRPTGIVEGEAMQRVRQRIPPPSNAEYRAALHAATALANSYGITSVFDAAVSVPMLAAYRDANKSGELTVRVVAAQGVDPRRGVEQVSAMIARRDETRGARVRADAAKIFLDGEIDMHTAALLAPYADAPEQRGELLIQPDALDAIVRRLDAEGFLIHMHAMGDRAVRVGLDAIERAAQANGARDRRHQLAHIGLVSANDIARFGALGVAANFQPLWFRADDSASAGIAVALGTGRFADLYPIASIAAHGGMLAASSDWPAPSMEPVLAMQVALTRQPFNASQPAQQPQERVDLATIIRAYTKNASWLAREEAIDGSIEVGKAADLVVLERNLFEVSPAQLRSVRVMATFLDGRIVFRNAAMPWPHKQPNPPRRALTRYASAR